MGPARRTAPGELSIAFDGATGEVLIGGEPVASGAFVLSTEPENVVDCYAEEAGGPNRWVPSPSLGFGRIVASGIEAPNMLVNLV